MAIYHLSVKIIGRSVGRSAVAAAAYRSGEVLTNEYDGITHDYSRKNWIEYSTVFIPKNAPREYKDRNTLWNAVEKAEKSSDAQLAREIEVALPKELGINEQVDLVNRFVMKNFVKEGMCADYSIHNPPLRNDLGQPIDRNGNTASDRKDYIFGNPHAHIMLTMRPIDENGKWEAKSAAEYICKKDGKERAFTAGEFKKAKNEGWEKQYRYRDGGKKVWLTPKEAGLKNLERINKTPKTSVYGRRNEKTAKWNSVETEKSWRREWEAETNRKLAECGIAARIDSRSLKEQGRTDEIATVHMGPAVSQQVKKHERAKAEGRKPSCIPEIYLINEEIKAHNRLVNELNRKIDELAGQIEKLTLSAADSIDRLTEELFNSIRERNRLNDMIRIKKTELESLKHTVSSVSAEAEKTRRANERSNAAISELSERLEHTGRLKLRARAELQGKMDEERENIRIRNGHLAAVLKRYRVDSLEMINTMINEYSDGDRERKEMVNNLLTVIKQIKNAAVEYLRLVGALNEENRKDIENYLDSHGDRLNMKDIMALSDKEDRENRKVKAR